MASLWLPIVYAIALWWLSTGLILYLDGLPRHTHRWSLLAASLLLPFAAWGLLASGGMPSLAGAYLGFTSALLLWGWIEMSFLMGFVTGPRKSPLPEGTRGRRRFLAAFAAVAYHEILLFAVLLLLLPVGLAQANPVGAWTFLVLWIMRLSTKLNIFLGVRNLNENWLPEHLRYLASYFNQRSMNALFPFSVVASMLATSWVLAHALAAPAASSEAAALLLIGTLLALGLIEHLFLILPMTLDGLFRWGFRSRSPLSDRQGPG